MGRLAEESRGVVNGASLTVRTTATAPLPRRHRGEVGMTELPVRVAWTPRALSLASADHPELSDEGHHSWLVGAIDRHTARTPRVRSVLSAALAVDGAFEGEDELTIRVYSMPASLLAALDASLNRDESELGRATGRSWFVQEAVLVALAEENLPRRTTAASAG